MHGADFNKNVKLNFKVFKKQFNVGLIIDHRHYHLGEIYNLHNGKLAVLGTGSIVQAMPSLMVKIYHESLGRKCLKIILIFRFL